MNNAGNLIDRVTREICAGRCGQMGDPPCWLLDKRDGREFKASNGNCNCDSIAAAVLDIITNRDKSEKMHDQ